MRMSGLGRNMAMLQMEQKENSKSARDEVRTERQQQAAAKLVGLNKNEEASNIRGEAEGAKAVTSSVATGLGVAAAICAFLPGIGPAIAAVLAAIAAVVMLIGQLTTMGEEAKAAAKDREAGLQDLVADKHKNTADDVKKEDQERHTYVDQFREKLIEMNKEGGETAKF